MNWFRVDDKLCDHRKSRVAGSKAMGLWVLCGSWSMANLTDGFVPDDVMKRWGSAREAQKLQAATLWTRAVVGGEKGWQFHEWEEWQPTAESLAAERESNRKRLKRWREAHASNGVGNGVTNGVANGEVTVTPKPKPKPKPSNSLRSLEEEMGRKLPISTEIEVVAATNERPDTLRVCEELQRRIEANTGRAPRITKAWLNSARLLMDVDGHSEADVLACIAWCQSDDFWRGNVLSMQKLRIRYDQLSLAAQRKSTPRRGEHDFSAAMQRLAGYEQGTDEAPTNGRGIEA